MQILKLGLSTHFESLVMGHTRYVPRLFNIGSICFHSHLGGLEHKS